MLNKHVGAGPACPGAVDTHWNASVPKCGTLPKNAIFGKYVRRHLVSVEHRSFGLVHGKGVFYKCETPLGCKLQYKHLCSQRKKRSELLHTLPRRSRIRRDQCRAESGLSGRSRSPRRTGPIGASRTKHGKCERKPKNRRNIEFIL